MKMSLNEAIQVVGSKKIAFYVNNLDLVVAIYATKLSDISSLFSIFRAMRLEFCSVLGEFLKP